MALVVWKSKEKRSKKKEELARRRDFELRNARGWKTRTCVRYNDDDYRCWEKGRIIRFRTFTSTLEFEYKMSFVRGVETARGKRNNLKWSPHAIHTRRHTLDQLNISARVWYKNTPSCVCAPTIWTLYVKLCHKYPLTWLHFRGPILTIPKSFSPNFFPQNFAIH